eukprot:978431-Rhodomonas_salina.2
MKRRRAGRRREGGKAEESLRREGEGWEEEEEEEEEGEEGEREGRGHGEALWGELMGSQRRARPIFPLTLWGSLRSRLVAVYELERAARR